MNLGAMNWKYDENFRNVVDVAGMNLVCNLAPGQAHAVGELIAKAPRMMALGDKLPASLDNWSNLLSTPNMPKDLTASSAGMVLAAAPAITAIATDLHAQLGASLSSWRGEEDSVREEHADLIKELEAADARATAVLTAPGNAALPVGALRSLAHTLLARAQEIDGLRPYVVTHFHPHGETFYTTWSATPPTEKQMADLLVEKYEPERGDSLGYCGLAIADMTGTLLPSQGNGDADQGEESEEAASRPSGHDRDAGSRHPGRHAAIACEQGRTPL